MPHEVGIVRGMELGWQSVVYGGGAIYTKGIGISWHRLSSVMTDIVIPFENIPPLPDQEGKLIFLVDLKNFFSGIGAFKIGPILRLEK